jgi:hypothetical protein
MTRTAPPEPAAADRGPWSRSQLAAVAVVLSLVGWALWLYLMPAGYMCSWGLNPDRAEHFREVLRLPSWSVTVPAFRRGLGACLAATWLAYVVLLSTALAGGSLPRRWVTRLAAATALFLAVVGPPALSADVYAYVGYARLALVHGISPYVGTQQTLIGLGDLTARFLYWPIPSPYGPLWTLLSLGVVALLPKSLLWVPVVLFKLLGAASVLFLAEGARRLAARLPSARADVVFAAIALNPLFLFEGVVSGHNDMFMMALVVWSLVVSDERPRASFLLLGLAASIKFIPLLLAPWLLTSLLRRSPPRRWPALTVEAVSLTLAPLVLAFAPFWRGVETLAGLRARSNQGLHPAGNDMATQATIVLGLYAALCVFVARGQHKWVLRAWVIASLSVIVFTTGMWFPWYFSWPLAVSLILIDGLDLCFAGIVFGGMLLSLWSYVR